MATTAARHVTTWFTPRHPHEQTPSRSSAICFILPRHPKPYLPSSFWLLISYMGPYNVYTPFQRLRKTTSQRATPSRCSHAAATTRQSDEADDADPYRGPTAQTDGDPPPTGAERLSLHHDIAHAIEIETKPKNKVSCPSEVELGPTKGLLLQDHSAKYDT